MCISYNNSTLLTQKWDKVQRERLSYSYFRDIGESKKFKENVFPWAVKCDQIKERVYSLINLKQTNKKNN